MHGKLYKNLLKKLMSHLINETGGGTGLLDVIHSPNKTFLEAERVILLLLETELLLEEKIPTWL